MTHKDIIVIGASAGGIEPLKQLVAALPADFSGTLFIVLHIPAYSESYLPMILSKAGHLTAVHPRDGEAIEKGMIYVAPADHHLLLEEGRVIIRRGPKENRVRPSIDSLFRSAAYVYGSRVIGIILSGLLNDGASGLWSIKQQGGVAIVQTPSDAQQPQMPENALEYIDADYTVTVEDMAPLLTGMVRETSNERFKVSEKEMNLLKMEVVIASRDNAFEMGIMNMGELTPFTCAECHGSLVRLVEGKIIRFRCHTGHAYTASSLLASVTESVEDMLWQAMRGMEEMTMLMNSIADNFESLDNRQAAAPFRQKALEAAGRARVIHNSVFRQEQLSEDLRMEDKKPS